MKTFFLGKVLMRMFLLGGYIEDESFFHGKFIRSVLLGIGG